MTMMTIRSVPTAAAKAAAVSAARRRFLPSLRSAASSSALPPPAVAVADRFFSTASSGNDGNGNSTNKLRQIKTGYAKEIDGLPETKARSELSSFLSAKSVDSAAASASSSPFKHRAPTPPKGGYDNLMTPDQIKLSLDAAMATFHLHCESRIAALCGQGFYTIGPCGEELLSSVGCALHPTNDAVALHYRHLGVSVARQLRSGRSMEDVLLDRARGYVVSRNDPVTGGVHCAIGSAIGEAEPGVPKGGGDYVVTSTLASQCPPAVGRALGFSLAEKFLSADDPVADGDTNSSSKKKKKRNQAPVSDRPISYVTLGDGSLHNSHFLAAYNLARHARYRRIKCPAVFGISDNGLSISYSTDGYAQALFDSTNHNGLLGGDNDATAIPVFRANGTDMLDVYDKTLQAADFSRRQSSPSLILYTELTRRFGHAATDRQHAYLSPDDVNSMMESDVVSGAVIQAVEEMGVGTYGEWRDRFEELGIMAERAFEVASEEEKITRREDMMEQVSAKLVRVPRLPEEETRGIVDSDPKVNSATEKDSAEEGGGGSKGKAEKPEVMRKHMTRVISETLASNPSTVYIGEDVEHGGYYLVTDGLASEFPGRVVDFPPDETTLLGAAVGYAQVGLVPIVEIPYAKYLDCGVDMFYELAMSHWLTNGQRPNGMVIRVQGFGRGVFGGNFHTHNVINHVPPGVDVVCYSNGRDYARGFRNAVMQAEAGRVVMLIDCTHILNLRHVHGRDRGWETPYPIKKGEGGDVHEGDVMGFDDVLRYGTQGKHAIVSYGNGVVTCLQARRILADSGILSSESDLDVVDCPYLSSVPSGLREVLSSSSYSSPDGGVLFADICKDGPGSNVFSSFVAELRRTDDLPENWEVVAAPRTYNPLGNVLTFLSEEDVAEAFERMVGRRRGDAEGGKEGGEEGRRGEPEEERRVAQ